MSVSAALCGFALGSDPTAAGAELVEALMLRPLVPITYDLDLISLQAIALVLMHRTMNGETMSRHGPARKPLAFPEHGPF